MWRVQRIAFGVGTGDGGLRSPTLVAIKLRQGGGTHFIGKICYFKNLGCATRGVMSAVPLGLRRIIKFSNPNPTLKRGANKRCAYGADFRLAEAIRFPKQYASSNNKLSQAKCFPWYCAWSDSLEGTPTIKLPALPEDTY
jgi:hypothetical protein